MLPPILGFGLCEWRLTPRGEAMPYSYAPQFSSRASTGCMRTGMYVSSPPSPARAWRRFFGWVRQDRVHRGELAGTSRAEPTQRRAAKRRFAESRVRTGDGAASNRAVPRRAGGAARRPLRDRGDFAKEGDATSYW